MLGFGVSASNRLLHRLPKIVAITGYNTNECGSTASTYGANVEYAAANFSNFSVTDSTDEIHTITAPGPCIIST